MRLYNISFDAANDIANIWTYTRNRSSVETADKVQQELLRTFEAIARMPKLGHRRPDFTSEPFLFFKVYSYLILYDPASKPLQIHAILHGARDIGPVLQDRHF